MRLWHKDLISVLPKNQLLGQWRECCLIAKNIYEKGTPNHILVNKIIDYPDSQFNVYALAVYDEMVRRGYECDWNRFCQWRLNRNYEWELKDIFEGWHNGNYLCQCIMNLEEKHDCGGISDREWNEIEHKFGDPMWYHK